MVVWAFTRKKRDKRPLSGTPALNRQLENSVCSVFIPKFAWKRYKTFGSNAGKQQEVMKGHAFHTCVCTAFSSTFWIFLLYSILFKHSYSCRLATDLSSPFLPEFEGPDGFSVTDPANKNKHMYIVASSL